MGELLDGAAGERMELGDYLSEFEQQFWNVGATGFWKLERRQHFREPGYDTWEAFVRGDWDESLRLLETHRAAIAEDHRRMEQRGVALHWVRVVEEPLTPYVQWELHVLRVREQCGSVVRVVRSEQVAALEAEGPVPEINVLGTAVMYAMSYANGALDGAWRFADPDLIARWRRIIAGLHAAGEPLADFFDREVAGLKPPTGEHAR
jgi:hypothetical protein